MAHWRERLPAAKRRIYDRSDAIRTVALRPSPGLLEQVRDLRAVLAAGDRRRVACMAQEIADGVCASLRVPALRVVVQGRRPSNDSGELHGLYTPGTRRDTVKVWMITAKLGRVVAYRTFLRTLVHEICHHLDYELFKLSDSLHTDGFYVRESHMLHCLLIDDAARGAGAGRATVGRAGAAGSQARRARLRPRVPR